MSKWRWLRKSVALTGTEWLEQNAPLFPINVAMLAGSLLYHYAK